MYISHSPVSFSSTLIQPTKHYFYVLLHFFVCVSILPLCFSSVLCMCVCVCVYFLFFTVTFQLKLSSASEAHIQAYAYTHKYRHKHSQCIYEHTQNHTLIQTYVPNRTNSQIYHSIERKRVLLHKATLIAHCTREQQQQRLQQ